MPGALQWLSRDIGRAIVSAMTRPPITLPSLEIYNDRPAKRPWPIKWALLGSVISAVMCLVALYFGGRALLGSPKIVATKALSTNDLFNLLKLIFAVIAGLGGVVALVVAYRRQKVLEEEIQLSARAQFHSEQVAENNAHDAAERRVTDLYGQSVEQLGHDKAAVRLGGLYSLERLAQDHDQHRQTVVDVVCAYLRMPFQVEARESVPDASPEVIIRNDFGEGPVQEFQVRLAAQRLLARHLRVPAAEESSSPAQLASYWSGMRVDLAGSHLIDVDFSGCGFLNADFSNARFSQGRARFNDSSFSESALFSSAIFQVGADFSSTTFGGGASFTDCCFKGQASYNSAKFQNNSGFNRSCFEQDAFFANTTFAKTTWLRRAEFKGNADFRSATFGEHAVIDYAQFSHDANFARAQFPGTAQFRGVDFSRRAQFNEAHFVGEVTFKSAKFRLSPRFTAVEFDSAAIFAQAKFERKPDFSRASAMAPNSMHSWPPSWQIDSSVPDGERGSLIEVYQPGVFPN